MNPKDDSSSADILSIFQRSQEAWKKLEPFKTATIPLSSLEHKICGRLLAHKIYNDTNSFQGIEFNDLKINCEMEPCSVPVWKRIADTGIDILDYSFDVTNDLLVIVKNLNTYQTLSRSPNRVFLLTMSDGYPHPQAAKSYLSFKQAEFLGQCHIKIVNDYLAISFRTMPPFGVANETLNIWNWKTGVQCHERDTIFGYAFLSPHAFALVVPVSKDSSNMMAGIELYHLGKQTADVLLALPYNGIPLEIILLSDKPTVDEPTTLESVPLSPFVIDETAERIIVVHSEGSLLFIACRPLLRILLDETIKPLSKKSYKLPYSRVFKWHQWGPENTIWLCMQPISPGFVAINGGRFCSLVESSQPIFITNKDARNSHQKTKLLYEKKKEDGDDELDNLVVDIQDSPSEQDSQSQVWSILILDFNPRPILRAASKRAVVSGAEEVVKDEENGEEGWWKRFRKRTRAKNWGSGSSKLNEPKLGGLPFRAYQRPMQRRCTDMIMTLDHIVGLVDDETSYDVLQFID
ncbi:hypothetical protein FRC14_001063 [Serendipita sp. 396]|nr:hypothetical protein FRC14_001063 [Serendipita sp. 396]KAG8774641.1 hypothetical protein FRC15_001147 [Serendipita sp. 397]KAG8790081.1 hypothetical protein FRC16_001053 [Serendipita sp. 398]KAG8817115.1 hypothetical protein FRC18_000681 [Serendipita sp. 400]KAG8828148.1 hypothetical protein FRC19_009232 [Serendipita sp. 401]KAG8846120.1 hypothetical protein FRB91_001145 [Serendipita sp. 411]KAG8863424.1 hypothetical protein FRC20_010754 [Serendipita sp. 405]KAG9058454.1 hypothetical prot